MTFYLSAPPNVRLLATSLICTVRTAQTAPHLVDSIFLNVFLKQNILSIFDQAKARVRMGDKQSLGVQILKEIP